MDEEHYFEKIGEYKLLAKHEVGQNFLIDASIAKKIVALANFSLAIRPLRSVLALARFPISSPKAGGERFNRYR
jgi:hypothetical protein